MPCQVEPNWHLGTENQELDFNLSNMQTGAPRPCDFSGCDASNTVLRYMQPDWLIARSRTCIRGERRNRRRNGR